MRCKTTMTAVMATHPYSSGITQSGSVPHVPVTMRKCHMTYVASMLTVQTMSGTVETEVRNGSSHSKYQGNTTGTHKSVAAIGQTNTSADNAFDARLRQIAVANPASNA